MLFGPQCEGIHVDTRVRGTGVVLERLHNIEVGPLTLGEAILAVKLELSGDDGVLSPAVHVKGSLGEHEGAGIREARGKASARLTEHSGVEGRTDGSGHGNVNRSRRLEEASGVDEGASSRDSVRGTKGVDGVRESIDGIRVVEGLGTEGLEEGLAGREGRAVVDVGVGLNNPEKLLARVVEVELDLVGGGPNGLVSSELELLEEVLVGVLRHLPALISVEEDVVNVEGGRNKGLLVGRGDLRRGGGSEKGANRPEALADGAKVEVNLDLVVLEGNQGEGKAGVAAEPELKGNIERGLGEGVAGSANLSGGTRGSAGSRNGRERGVRDVGELRGVSNHLEVSTLLLRGERNLVPDVHPVSILAVDALTSNLDLNLGNELLADEVHPAGIDSLGERSRGVPHGLIDLRKSDLKVGAVSKISVPGDGAGNAATEVSLTREGLLDGLHREVGVAPVRHLPESDLRGSREENVLRAVSYKLHKCSAHGL